MDHVTHRPATAADLLSLPDSVKGEILDGTLYTQPRPRALHSSLEIAAAADIYVPFDRGRGGPGGWWVRMEPGIELPRAAEFSPDVAGWRRSALPQLPGPGQPFRTVPSWICEVLSPSNRAYDLGVKRRFYAEIGVEHLWYIDLESRRLTVSRLHEGAWVELAVHGDDEVVRVEPFAELEIHLPEWWPEGS